MAIQTAPNYNYLDQLLGGSSTSGDVAETQANYVHSVLISEVNSNSFRDLYLWWHLVPTERPYIAPAEIKTQYVEIPGSDVELDYTEALSGTVNKQSRSGSWDFIMVPDGTSPITKYNAIQTFLNGKQRKIILRDDPDHYYKGRVWVGGVKGGKNYSTITIKYKVDAKIYDANVNFPEIG